jgi:VWFA-related protein
VGGSEVASEVSAKAGVSQMKTVLVFFLLVAPAFAQQNAAPSSSGGQTGTPAAARAENTDSGITLNVVVIDKSGKPVTGLQQQDFTVLDDKLPQKILSFHAVEAASSAAPVRVILLVDTVNASFPAVASAREEIAKFLRQNDGKLAQPVSTVFFTDDGAKTQNEPTRDGNAAAALLDKTESNLRTITRASGFYGAAERLNLSLRTLGLIMQEEAPIPGKKLLIWISPGWPMLSGPGVEISREEQQRLFNLIVGLSTGLREEDITLYNVDPLGTADAGGFRTFFYKDFVKGVKAAKNVQTGNLSLQVLAYQSGGRVLNSSNDVANEIASCVTDANAYYVLSFDSPPPDGPVQYHGLEIKIGKPGLTARTQTGYYALK